MKLNSYDNQKGKAFSIVCVCVTLCDSHIWLAYIDGAVIRGHKQI